MIQLLVKKTLDRKQHSSFEEKCFRFFFFKKKKEKNGNYNETFDHGPSV